jgi:hypothetical protein
MAKPSVQTAVESISPPMVPEEASLVSSDGETNKNLDLATVAYQLWEERGRPEGDPDCDWYEAERLIRPRKSG